MESQPISASADDVESGAAPTQRLVIRIVLGPEPSPQQPAQRRSSRGALLLLAGAAVVLLSWIAISLFRIELGSAPSAVTPVGSKAVSKPAAGAVATRAVEVAPSVTTNPTAESEARQQPDAPPASVNEVLPDVPRNARDTIRGTIRVSVRVVIDQDGAVVRATADDPGPSRYFERLAIEAAKRWRFTRANSPERRVMRVRFNFTRAGTTADANPVRK